MGGIRLFLLLLKNRISGNLGPQSHKGSDYGRWIAAEAWSPGPAVQSGSQRPHLCPAGSGAAGSAVGDAVTLQSA